MFVRKCKDFIRHKKTRKRAAVHFGTDDLVINGYHLNSIHSIPPEFEENLELDFYLDTKYDIYLLRLRNNNKRCITVFPPNKCVDIIYIVAELPFAAHYLPDTIQTVLYHLQALGIPQIKNPRQVTVIKF